MRKVRNATRLVTMWGLIKLENNCYHYNIRPDAAEVRDVVMEWQYFLHVHTTCKGTYFMVKVVLECPGALSRQPLVKGQRLARIEANAVMTAIERKPRLYLFGNENGWVALFFLADSKECFRVHVSPTNCGASDYSAAKKNMSKGDCYSASRSTLAQGGLLVFLEDPNWGKRKPAYSSLRS